MAYTRMIGKTAPPKPRTMTVLLDLTDSDPTHWATYADDAVGMEAGSDDWDDFFGHYPCILDNGVELGKLNRNDFSKYEDNTSAPITTLGKDVMICFPKRGIKIEYLDANTLSVSMTDEDDKTGYSYMAHSYKGNPCNKFYLGVYMGYATSNNLYSVSGQTPTVSQTIGTFRTWAQARGTGYEQSAFFQLTYRQVMYLLKYKGQNAQTAVGMGFVDSTNTAVYGNVGYTNDKGMDWGENTGKYPMKLFGLEDFYGNLWEFIDGVCSNANFQIYVADGNYNDDGTNYISANTPVFSSQVEGYLKLPNGTNLSGFTHSAASYSSATTYFCDIVSLINSRAGSFGGSWNNGTSAGIFKFYIYRRSTNVNAAYGARLMYMKQSS